ncbi:MAG: hypothetical protein IPG61_19370 [bacterium]|nr:hypothetical protein [bacterium]
MMTRETPRRLPSIDAIAFGIGVVALAGTWLYPRLEVAFALAVFLPSVLREIGWLKDADEWTMGVTRRAGFHALLAVAVLLFAGRLGPNVSAAFSGETPRKLLVEVFAVSYLLQYWGARAGTFRLLLGASVLTAASISIVLTGSFAERTTAAAGFVLLAAAGLAGLAFLARRAPRVTGWLLLALCALPLAMVISQHGESRLMWTPMVAFLHAAVVLGISGGMLVRGRE